MPDINPDRLLSTLESLRAIGRSGAGVHRPALSSSDLDARAWLLRRLETIGLAAEMDRFGTVLGKARVPKRTVLIGSHTDTVPNGGWLDGALGVAYGLEVATAHAEAYGPENARIDVISFQDEEGTFVPCLGSRAFVGDIVAASAVAECRALDGRRLDDALSRGDLTGRPILRIDPGRNIAFLEASQRPTDEASRFLLEKRWWGGRWSLVRPRRRRREPLQVHDFHPKRRQYLSRAQCQAWQAAGSSRRVP